MNKPAIDQAEHLRFWFLRAVEAARKTRAAARRSNWREAKRHDEQFRLLAGRFNRLARESV